MSESCLLWFCLGRELAASLVFGLNTLLRRFVDFMVGVAAMTVGCCLGNVEKRVGLKSYDLG